MVMMRFLALLAFSVAGLTLAVGQNKLGTFKLPRNAHYARGRVLVKVKPGFKEIIAQLGAAKSTARVRNISVLSVAPLVKPELARQGAARRGPRNYQPKVDISRYFAIAFDPAQNIEDFINQLYGTGYFDIIEPEYAYHTTLTPNDPLAFNQYYLNTIKALEAWDITQGDTTITIAIVDSGGNLTHPR